MTEGNVAKSAAERMRSLRERRKDDGFVEVRVRVPEYAADSIRERSERIRLHLRLSTYRGVIGLEALDWASVEHMGLDRLRAMVETLRRDADLAIEAERLANRIDQQGDDWSE